MNTNSNLYTVIYTSVIVIVVAALLAFVSQSLKSKQEANEKADTISQMMTAAGFGTKAEFQKMGNAAVLARYAEEIAQAYTVNTDGEKVADMDLSEVYSPSRLKKQNYNIKGAGQPELPVFVFRNGITVVPVYGAGLWGPVWGYLAFEQDHVTIKGAYFDHESETAGLGAKIKDDPDFQAEFSGEKAHWSEANVFEIVKGGSPKNADGTEIYDNKIDAITGATMTSMGLDTAIDTWLGAYSKHFAAAESCAPQGESCCCSGCEKSCCATCPCTKCCQMEDCTKGCGPACCSEQCGCCADACCETKTVEE